MAKINPLSDGIKPADTAPASLPPLPEAPPVVIATTPAEVITEPAPEVAAKPERDPLILTVAEHAQLSAEEKSEFRHAGGTVAAAL